MPLLGVNIDHVATLRQARAGSEPEPIQAGFEACLGGADILTVHLREDRRHIQDRDVELLMKLSGVRVNLEMAATKEMLAIALRLKPGMVTLVPEGRREITTEGGLDLKAQGAAIKRVVAALRKGGVTTSAFIDPDEKSVRRASEIGFHACEVHTGPYAAGFAACGGDFDRPALREQFEKLAAAGGKIQKLGMRFHAGHALNYQNTRPVASLPGLAEVHIGHAIISRAVFVGLRQAVRSMKELL